MGSSKKSIFLRLPCLLGIAIITYGCTGAPLPSTTEAPQGIQGPTGVQGNSTPAATQGAPTTTGTGQVSPAINVVKMITPTVVRVNVSGLGFAASGSGVIVDPRGYIITNHHVISNANQITVTLMSGDSYGATVVESETTRDLALLKMSTNRSDFPTAVLGTNADAIVGEDVLVAGFPLGPDLPGPVSFNKGIVSALRTYNGLNYVQTDAPVNPGNSGGCLATLQGKVIGITVAGIVPPTIDAEGINLAIPIDDTETFIQKGLPK